MRAWRLLGIEYPRSQLAVRLIISSTQDIESQTQEDRASDLHCSAVQLRSAPLGTNMRSSMKVTVYRV